MLREDDSVCRVIVEAGQIPRQERPATVVSIAELSGCSGWWGCPEHRRIRFLGAERCKSGLRTQPVAGEIAVQPAATAREDLPRADRP